MDKPENLQAPPLAIWGLLLLATAGLLGLIYQANNRAADNAAAAVDSCLMVRAAAAKDRPVVLVIGTSLTQAGLDSTTRIVRCIEETSGTRIALLKCWQSGADLRELTIHHAALFRRLHPSVVLIEANTLFYRPLRQAALSRYMQTFRDMVRGIKKDDLYDPDDRGVVTLGGRAELETFRAGVVDSAALAAFRTICAEWQRQKVSVGFVNFPLEQMAEKAKWQSPDTAVFYRNLRFLRRTGPVFYDDAAMQLDSSDFYDYGHLNHKGSNYFAPWFCRLLSARVQQSLQAGKIVTP